MTTCGFCGLEFDPASAEVTCQGCPVVGNCGLVRCPRCGYEMPPESKLAQWLRELGRSVRQRASGDRIQEQS